MNICERGGGMRIGFIGAGRMGFTLGRYLRDKVKDGDCSDVEVTGYYSRNPESARQAAEFTDTKYYDDVADLLRECDVLFLTVPDGQIAVTADELDRLGCAETTSGLKSLLDGKILCHTSGALSSEVFSGIKSRVYGYSIHPMYAVSSKTESYKNFNESYITIEGDEKYLEYFYGLFSGFGHHVSILTAENKVKYHAASVCASNLVIGLYSMAVSLLEDCGFSEESADTALKPLFKNNALKLATSTPAEALTGPVERCDTETVRKHLDSLMGENRELYRLLSKKLVEVADGRADKNYDEMKKLLE
jgi:predicted short-subunit dehydrogenase-like oxidoreductase (DUF2520 family)